MKAILSLLMIALVLSLASSLQAAKPAVRDSVLDRPPAGFVALFNARDLAGWKGLAPASGNPVQRAKMSPEALAQEQQKADDNMRAHWSARDGLLLHDGSGQNLCTAKDYGNFELLIDWKIGTGGDTGVYLRGNPQVGIWDTTWPKYRPSGNEHGSGGLWNNTKHERFPTVHADNPVGQWNHFHIKIVGDRVTVHLNDKLVTDNVVLENYWEPAKPLAASGTIELQSHTPTIPTYFKNIFIKELP